MQVSLVTFLSFHLFKSFNRSTFMSQQKSFFSQKENKEKLTSIGKHEQAIPPSGFYRNATLKQFSLSKQSSLMYK